MHKLVSCFGLLGAVLLSSPLVSAGTLQSYLYFEDLVDAEPIGVGTMSFEGETPGDGLYAASEFADLGFNFTFNPLLAEAELFEGDLGSFTEANLASDLSGVSIYVSGGTFQFFGPPLGSFGGSVDFVNAGGDYLTFSPSFVPFFAYAIFVDRLPTEENDQPDLGGYYGIGAPSAVPEPSSAALLAGAAVLGLVSLRRRRHG